MRLYTYLGIVLLVVGTIGGQYYGEKLYRLFQVTDRAGEVTDILGDDVANLLKTITKRTTGVDVEQTLTDLKIEWGLYCLGSLLIAYIGIKFILAGAGRASSDRAQSTAEP